MNWKMGLVGLVGVLGLSALGTGCRDTKPYDQYMAEFRKLDKVQRKAIVLYGDFNKDGLVSKEEQMRLFGAVAQFNGGKYVQGKYFFDSNGDSLNDHAFKGDDIRLLQRWFSNYRPGEKQAEQVKEE